MLPHFGLAGRFNFRSTSRGELVPVERTSRMQRRDISVVVETTWYSLPSDLRVLFS